MYFKKRFRIVVGCTRIVFLCDHIAVKIARVRIVKPALFFVLYILNRIGFSTDTNRVESFLERNEVGDVQGSHGIARILLTGLRVVAWSGIEANLLEWKRWRKSRSYQLAPTLFSFGIVNIQKRVMQARPLEDDLIQRAHEVRMISPDDRDDYPDNRGYYLDAQGEMQLCWVDYGYHLSPLEI